MSDTREIVLRHPFFSRFQIFQESGDAHLASAYLDRDGLYNAILKNILSILDSRNNLRLSDDPALGEVSVINYGIPDFTVGGGHEFYERMAVYVKKSIIALEPRLTDVEIKIQGGEKNSMELRIHAAVTKDIYKDFEFFLKIRHSGLVDVG